MEDEITYQAVVARLAPCGIDCERCVMYADGRVRRRATSLAEALEGFENMAAKMAGHLPVLAQYDRFAEILALFSGASCTGCRSRGSNLSFCAARSCYREHNVDFCFQCDEYPCERNGYPAEFLERWRSYNDRMREVGVEQYYRESLDEPRYY